MAYCCDRDNYKEYKNDRNRDYEEKGYKHDKHECDFNDVKRYKRYREIQGKECNIRKDNYYENYYTRYNNYYVKECNHVKDYYRDVNIYHYSQETVYEGCEYLGSTTVKDCEKEHGQKPEFDCGCRPMDKDDDKSKGKDMRPCEKGKAWK